MGVRKGNIDVVQAQLQADDQLANVCDSKGNSALMLAAESACGNGIASALLTAKANVDAQSHGGMTALMWAARHGRADMVKSLVDAGASEDLKSSNGWRARDFAKTLGHHEVMAILKP